MHTFPNLFLPFTAAVTATIQEVAVCVRACVRAYARVSSDKTQSFFVPHALRHIAVPLNAWQ
jgi:hypothetical protein